MVKCVGGGERERDRVNIKWSEQINTILSLWTSVTTLLVKAIYTTAFTAFSETTLPRQL